MQEEQEQLKTKEAQSREPDHAPKAMPMMRPSRAPTPRPRRLWCAVWLARSAYPLTWYRAADQKAASRGGEVACALDSHERAVGAWSGRGTESAAAGLFKMGRG